MKILFNLLFLLLISCSKGSNETKTVIVDTVPNPSNYSELVFTEPEMYISEHIIEGSTSFESEGMIISSLYENEMTIMFYHYSDPNLNPDKSSKNISPALPPLMKVQWSKYNMNLSGNIINLTFNKSSCVNSNTNPLIGQIGSTIEFKKMNDVIEVITKDSSFNAKVLSTDEKDILLNTTNIKEVVCVGE